MAKTTAVKGFVRRKPSRKPFPDHLPRERVVVPGPTACACCGSERQSKIGEDITETLEVDYMLQRWDSFTRFLDDGRICLTNTAAERALRDICLGRKSWLFTDVLARIAEMSQTRLHEFLPWHWKADPKQSLAA